MNDTNLEERLANLEAEAKRLDELGVSAPYTAARLRDRAAHLRTLCQECGEKPGGPFCPHGGADE